jgi:hypothetical protein
MVSIANIKRRMLTGNSTLEDAPCRLPSIIKAPFNSYQRQNEHTYLPNTRVSSANSVTKRASKQRTRNNFTNDDDKLLLDSVREARKQGKILWDTDHTIWKEHAKSVSHNGSLGNLY